MGIIDQAKKLPNKPGIYMFLDDKASVLYVGRATFLKRRVASYFRLDIDPRIKEMVESASEIKHQVTDTVLESYISEAELIKRHWPKYNVRERDDRSFIYIVIAKKDYPKPIVVRGKELSKFSNGSAEVFGPFTSLRIAKEILKIARRIFPYSTCVPNQGKPCFHYQIGLCPGICIGAISKEDYQKNIKDLAMFLRGDKKRLLKKLVRENPERAESLKHIQDVALLSKEEGNGFLGGLNRIEGYDVSHFAGKETFGAMVVFSDGRENKDEYRLFKIKEAPANDDLAALKETIERRFNHPEWQAPDLILIDGGRPQVLFVSRVLEESKIRIPIVGISKLQKDNLVFPAGAAKSFKELAEAVKGTLLKVRDEAHRFANFARRRRKKMELRRD
ncbi:hypothetical protein C4572_02245 [Candidatus Parcubacteria bacterium]|nr:MAG: hypothetical protein C4572_02245 [Candidatus Parcubacteria bacterium]